MSEQFDAYYKWLGIPPEEQPPDHYRLLAIRRFESDMDVIYGAADQRMAHVRSFQSGPRSGLSQRILNELSAARVCLLSPEKKAAYDAQLQASLSASAPAAKSLPVAEPVEIEPSVSPVPRVVAPSGGAARRILRRRRTPTWLGPVAAGVAGLVVVAVIFILTGSNGPEDAASLARDESPAEAPSLRRPAVDQHVPEIHPGQGVGKEAGSLGPAEEEALGLEGTNSDQEAPTGLAAADRAPAGSILLMTFDAETIREENDSLTVLDLSPTESHGTVQGARLVSKGVAGEAFRFDGDDCVVLPTLREHLIKNLGAVSISLWMLNTKTKRFSVCFNLGRAGDTHLGIVCRNLAVALALPDRYGGGLVEVDRVAPGVWHHVVGVWDGQQKMIYLDGHLRNKQETAEFTLNPSSISSEPARIGSLAKEYRRKDKFFHGLIDELAIYPRALTEDEVATLHALGTQGKPLAVP